MAISCSSRLQAAAGRRQRWLVLVVACVILLSLFLMEWTDSSPSILLSAEASANPKGKSKAKKTKFTTRPPGSTAGAGRQLVDTMNHDIIVLSPKNFDAVITKSRATQPAAVLFHKKDKAAETYIDSTWQAIAAELKGQVKIGAVDCEDFAAFCKSQAAELLEEQSFDLLIYPTQPLPQYSAKDIKDDPKKIRRSLLQYVPTQTVIVIPDIESMETFMSKQGSLPKVLLFSDKSQPPTMYHSLANAFADRMMFGFVPSSAETLVGKFHVKKFPSLIVKRGDRTISAKGSEVYKGALNYRDIHDFVNVRSETFVKGGGFDQSADANNRATNKDSKPWLVQRVPELTRASHQDVCFKQRTGFCFVYVTHDESFLTAGATNNKTTTLSNEELTFLETFAEEFDNDASKKPFHFSFINAAREKDFAKAFGMDDPDRKFPSAIVFNPHKRIRWTALDSDKAASTDGAIRGLIEKVLNGDGHFKIVKGNKLPQFVSRTKPTVTATVASALTNTVNPLPAMSPGRAVKETPKPTNISPEETPKPANVSSEETPKSSAGPPAQEPAKQQPAAEASAAPKETAKAVLPEAETAAPKPSANNKADEL